MEGSHCSNPYVKVVMCIPQAGWREEYDSIHANVDVIHDFDNAVWEARDTERAAATGADPAPGTEFIVSESGCESGTVPVTTEAECKAYYDFHADPRKNKVYQELSSNELCYGCQQKDYPGGVAFNTDTTKQCYDRFEYGFNAVCKEAGGKDESGTKTEAEVQVGWTKFPDDRLGWCVGETHRKALGGGNTKYYSQSGCLDTCAEETWNGETPTGCEFSANYHTCNAFWGEHVLATLRGSSYRCSLVNKAETQVGRGKIMKSTFGGCTSNQMQQDCYVDQDTFWCMCPLLGKDKSGTQTSQGESVASVVGANAHETPLVVNVFAAVGFSVLLYGAFRHYTKN